MSKNTLTKTCSHPLFKYASQNSWSNCSRVVHDPWVFVFDRSLWKTPSREQIDEYRRNKVTVEQLGGYMRRSEYSVAGENPALSKSEVEEILAAVVRDNPTGRIVDHWNGEGCYMMSVGMEFPS